MPLRAITSVMQVPTKRTTAAKIMASAEFERGLADVRSGSPFDWRIGATSANGAWDYERGRLFGRIAPPNMPLRIGADLNQKAVALYEAASRRGYII